MDSCDHSEEPSRQRNNEDKVRGGIDYSQFGQTFTAELTVCQANAISKLLPLRYTLQMDRATRNKKTNSRRRQNQPQQSKSRFSKEQEDIFVENNSFPQPVAEPVHTMSYDDMIKRAQKIVTQLRKNKNGWPFLQPVDPIAMGIPHYAQIVTDPMDLRTVANNLNEGRYMTITQFYADIELIIKNSFIFNKSNAQFLKITQDFQKAYEKLKAQPIVISKPSTKPIQRTISSPMGGISQSKPLQSIQKNKSQPKSFITITQKKQLAAKIKNLPPDELFELGRIICDGVVPQNFQLNLENMSVVKLNIIQQFLQKKQRKSFSSKKEVQRKESEGESSFQSDSDS